MIANEDFFHREYADPRRELENGGIRVILAAGRKSSCRPHPGTDEGADGGIVNPDLALSEVKADRFDAILFSGSWGASCCPFTFPGQYDKASYNGDRSIRAEANRVINELIEQDKYVCALCNGVSVLAWPESTGKVLWKENAFALRPVRPLPGSTPDALLSRHVCGIPK